MRRLLDEKQEAGRRGCNHAADRQPNAGEEWVVHIDNHSL
jgi:hypothetical protein